MELDTGAVLDRYTIESPLGEGGMAVVYKVRHNQLGTWHALKILTLSSRSIRERLLQEGRVQAALRHPNIVAVTDVISVQGAPGLVMEYIAGPSLEDLLQKTALTAEQAEALGRGIIQGVKAAHDKGLIHRDLKPANVLLDITDSGLVPKVTDFGLSKIVSGDSGMSKTRSGVAMGTPSYMSPEQIRSSKDVDHRTDVFALGAILYDLFCGRQAFPGEDLLSIFSKVTSGDFEPPSKLNPNIPPHVEAAILSALEVDRDKRCPNCEVLLAKLSGSGTPAPGPTAPLATSGPWTGDFLSSAKSMGSSTGDSFDDIVSGRSAQQAQASSSQGGSDTFMWDAGDENTAPSKPVRVPDGTISPPTSSIAPPESQRKMGLILLSTGLVGMLLVGVGGITAWSMMSSAEPEPVEQVAVAEPEPTPEPEPTAEPEPTPEPEAVADGEDPANDGAEAADGAADAAVEAPPEPVVKVVPKPAPPAPVKTVTVAAAPQPQPVVAPEPAPPPEPTMAPGHGLVTIKGSMSGLYLVPVGKLKLMKPGEVPAGEYNIQQKVGDSYSTLGKVKVVAGQTHVLNCDSIMMICR